MAKEHTLNFKEVESYIKLNKELYKNLYTGKKFNDFNRLDFVKCTYLRGILRIVDTTDDNKLIVESVPKYTELLEYNIISPEFINKIAINENTVDLLYAKND